MSTAVGLVRSVAGPLGVRSCPRCAVAVWTAVTAGVPVHIDPACVNADGLDAAGLSGRWAFSLDRQPDGVRVAHRCREPVPDAHRAPPA
ncbi:hypothetical protein Val02_68970 [Virgisporangium aliadipatigenens]|uniref:Uncharacterized protein n=1 Tax=Virgisporangium aliadipatigenens TaxID=741659 RepID=A0A8J3YRA5_9ACTN|nr:hypothetical protein [Virgisporangium aliadipatigenens]GIJ50011.1 hypothetical protein Val02_68970 [Virgisporangium aliadipatigenens]